MESGSEGYSVSIKGKCESAVIFDPLKRMNLSQQLKVKGRIGSFSLLGGGGKNKLIPTDPIFGGLLRQNNIFFFLMLCSPWIYIVMSIIFV